MLDLSSYVCSSDRSPRSFAASMKIRRFSRAAACPTNSASDFGRSAASASAGVRMGVVRAGSVKMLDPLADNRDPWFQPFFVNRHGRYKSVTRLEMAERHCIEIGRAQV